MNKDKLSYYSSYIAIICGIFLIIMKYYANDNSNLHLVMALLFISIGLIGLRQYRNKI